MPAFEQPRDRQRARRELGLDERPTALITGGGQSIGTLASVREILADARNNVRLLVNAPGTMAKDRHILDRLAKAYPDTLKVFDWTDDMSLLMSAADVVVGKPGGLTVSEALACGRPFLATCSLGGQEGHNLRFLEQHRIGCLVPPSALGDHLGRLFAQPGRLTEWQDRAAAQGRRHGASEVAKMIMACADGTAVREAAIK
jgi:UDP-N-acetylglucosamine:LPS N-acetylglucosamine transferase